MQRRSTSTAPILLLCAWGVLGGGYGAPVRAGGAKGTHWAFLRPVRPPVPRLENPDSCRNPIDAFVLARLEEEGLEPSPEAERAVLCRRLFLDLLGLLPEPEELDRFLLDPRPDVYERLADRLLASPHFGERWAIHWLDLARYADSDGYEKDLARPHAWRWRDWVIRAFNEDIPYDRFTIEQIAGDLLPGAGIEERVATGFHRNTLTNREGGVDREEDRVKQVADRVDTVGTVWLGLTIACAHCHSHKYDPITQKEYFGLYAFFNSADEKDIPAPLPLEAELYEEARKRYERRLAELQGRVGGGGEELETLKKSAPKPPATKAQVLVERPEKRETRIHIRGDFLRPGEVVSPHTPAVLPPLEARGAVPDRLDLARWLLKSGHPLTGRVAANRVWMQLFGYGLVRTPEDFGTRGEPPTHPRLLDWLALEYPHRGWSRKAMVRLVVTSATYRRSSAGRPDLAGRDPQNRFLARQNRFRPEAEVLWDITLEAGGLLTRRIGGPSVRPPLPADVAALGYAGSVKWPESRGADRYRRGLYIFRQRTVPYPLLKTFDAPEGVVTCPRRERSETPLQALALLNDRVFVECARGFASRVLAAPGGGTARIRLAFRTALSREPEDWEIDALRRALEDFRALLAADPKEARRLAGGVSRQDVPPLEAAAWTALARVLLNLDEFQTRG